MRTPQGKLAAKTSLRDWEGEWIPLEKGAAYRLSARWKKDAAGEGAPRIFVRTKAAQGGAGVPGESEPLEAGVESVSVRGGEEAAWAQVCFRSGKAPGEVLEEVVFRRE